MAHLPGLRVESPLHSVPESYGAHHVQQDVGVYVDTISQTHLVYICWTTVTYPKLTIYTRSAEIRHRTPLPPTSKVPHPSFLFCPRFLQYFSDRHPLEILHGMVIEQIFL